ncbi:hypothetical protein RHMOL_Rhmol13G0128400 [Rhododendron molle]|uniref:Uncharacterized protein n=1 Tax=Rhododendron molle TaxID=49168 RepID=A0ACC0L6L5_RHOML|nr:hypothetical protein RHMOL_Rhmol13G0128400 [Rhododendron molle]
MSDIYCSKCKRAADVVFVHSAGNTVCSECGEHLPMSLATMTPFVLGAPATLSSPTRASPPLYRSPTALLLTSFHPHLATGGIATSIAPSSWPSGPSY